MSLLSAPLADRLRPTELSEICGQKHILGEGKLLRKIAESGVIPNLIFFGPSGTGKTTVARILAKKAGKKLSNLFLFAEDIFPDGQEMLILVTELTISRYGARFISRYGCKEYFAHNKELLFYERRKEIINEIQTLELE